MSPLPSFPSSMKASSVERGLLKYIIANVLVGTISAKSRTGSFGRFCFKTMFLRAGWKLLWIVCPWLIQVGAYPHQGLGKVGKVGGAGTIFRSFISMQRRGTDVKFYLSWRGNCPLCPRCSRATDPHCYIFRLEMQNLRLPGRLSFSVARSSDICYNLVPTLHYF